MRRHFERTSEGDNRVFWPAKKEKDLHETICNASIHENVENSINLSINSVQSETEKEIVDRATEKKRKSEFFRLGQALPKTKSENGLIGNRYSTVTWRSSELEETVLRRIVSSVDEKTFDHVVVRIRAQNFDGDRIIKAATYHNELCVTLEVEPRGPPLSSIELLRQGTSGSLSTTLGLGIWSTLALQHVLQVILNDGIASLWDHSVLSRFESLKTLDLSRSAIGSLPSMVSLLSSLIELRLDGNKLQTIPPEIGRLSNLQVLSLNSNNISILPGELNRCTALRHLFLEANQLSRISINFRSLHQLHSLHLLGNPLEALPDIVACAKLRSLSVANLRIEAKEDFSSFKVDVVTLPNSGPAIKISLFDSNQSEKLSSLGLMLRSSSSHHPLVAGALYYLADIDPKSVIAAVTQDNVLQQLIFMVLNENSLVVQQTCGILSLLSKQDAKLAETIIRIGFQCFVSLMLSDSSQKQIAVIDLISTAVLSNESSMRHILNSNLVTVLLGISNDPRQKTDLRTAALKCLGNLGFCKEGKIQLRKNAQVIQDLTAFINCDSENCDASVKSAAIRALAILGEVNEVERAVGRCPEKSGIRILSLDGGGMKGLATVRMLKELEKRTSKPIHRLFDLIVGTSTGALLAVALGLRKFSLSECEKIYKELGQKVFSRPVPNTQERERSWIDVMTKSLQSTTEHVRVVVVGHKHDTNVYEQLLKEYCNFSKVNGNRMETIICTSSMDVPKIALVSTKVNDSPASPFVFRNYEFPASTRGDEDFQVMYGGSPKHEVWQAVRASSAAMYYLDEFLCGNDKYQDGAVVANNPAVVAMHEALRIWPERPIRVLISVGTGSTPPAPRPKAVSSFVEAGSMVIESATNVDRAHEALSIMRSLVPTLNYFRFDPVDDRCNMDLDEISSEKWERLEAAADDYVDQKSNLFELAAKTLMGNMPKEKENTNQELSQRRPANVCLISSQPFQASGNGANPGISACDESPYEKIELSTWDPKDDNMANFDLGYYSQGTNFQEKAKINFNVGDKDDQLEESFTQEDDDHAIDLERKGLSGALNSVFSWISPSKKEASESSRKERHVEYPEGAGLIEHDTLHMTKFDNASQGPSRTTALDHVEKLDRVLLYAKPKFQVLHFQMRTCDAGMILGWKHSYRAITVPSDQSKYLISQLGHDPELKSLHEVFEEHQGEIYVNGELIRRLSFHYTNARNGVEDSVALTEHFSAQSVLDSDGVKRRSIFFRGKLVICSSWLPDSLKEAFKQSGVVAVINANESIHAKSRIDKDLLEKFWCVFYSKLHDLGDVKSSLQCSEDYYPELRDYFCIF